VESHLEQIEKVVENYENTFEDMKKIENKESMILKIITITLFIACFSGYVRSEEKQSKNIKVQTSNGIVNVRSGNKIECKKLQDFEECQLLEWNGKTLVSQSYVQIEDIVPTIKEAKVVFASAATGGNACCEWNYLIDFTMSKPIIIQVEALTKQDDEKSKIQYFDGGFTYENYGSKNGPLGEPMWNVYRYKYGSGKLEQLRSIPRYSFSEIQRKKYPNEILDDPLRRAPIVEITGNQQFLELRSRMLVAPPIQKLTKDLYVGQGCMPHSCGTDESIFILNATDKVAWAMYIFSKETTDVVSGKFFGNPETMDTNTRNVIEKWMDSKKLRWSQIALTKTTDKLKTDNAMLAEKYITRLETEGGVYKVPVLINGVITLGFIVDSGASDVVIPSDVVSVMMKSGTLNASDFSGTKIYKLADGSSAPSKTFKIRSIQIGNRKVENVEASMTGTDGMLLLGQSFLNRFQRWSFNNKNHTLELE